MDRLNPTLLAACARIHREGGSASIVVEDGKDRRILHVAHGRLVGADSNVHTERLGYLLAELGRLDPVLIEPIALEALRHGRLLGDQLVLDGLLQAHEMPALLERQALLRFELALVMNGTAQVRPAQSAAKTIDASLGGAVTAMFRQRIAYAPIRDLLGSRNVIPSPLDLQSPRVSSLGLLPQELRMCRALLGRPITENLATLGAEPVHRLAAALVGLELWQ